MPQVTGWLPAGSVAASAFTNPNNALTSDSNRATVTWTTGERQIVVYNFTGLAAAIPTGAIIRGIEARVEGSRTGAALAYEYHELVNANTFRPKSQSTKTLGLTGTETRIIMGSGVDRWGDVDTNGTGGFDRLWTKSDFTSNFALELNFAASSSSTVSINAAWIQITYDVAGAKDFALAFAQTEGPLFVANRNRRVVPNVAQTEVYIANTFDRQRRNAFTDAQVQTYSSPLVKLERRFSIPVQQVENFSFLVYKAKKLVLNIPQVETFLFNLMVPKYLTSTISQVSGIDFTATLRRNFNIPVDQVEVFSPHISRAMFLAGSVPQQQTLSFTIGAIWFLSMAVNQIQGNTYALDRRLRLLPGAINQTQANPDIPLKRGRLNTFGFSEAEALSFILRRAQGLQSAIAENEVIASIPLRRALRLLTNIAELSDFDFDDLDRARLNTLSIAEQEQLSFILRRAVPMIIKDNQFEEITPFLNRAQRVQFLYEERQNTLPFINLARSYVFNDSQVEVITNALNRGRRLRPTINEVEAVTSALIRARTLRPNIAQTEVINIDVSRMQIYGLPVHQIETVSARTNRGRNVGSLINEFQTINIDYARNKGMQLPVEQVEEILASIGIRYALGVDIHQVQELLTRLTTVYVGPDPSAYSNDIIVDQGASVNIVFNVSSNGFGHDLTGWSIRAQIRRTYDDIVLIDATVDNGRMRWLDQYVGTFALALSEYDTSYAGNPKLLYGPKEESADCVYDIELVSPLNTVYKISRGAFVINREATR